VVGDAQHLRVSVPSDWIAEVAPVYAVGRRVNLFEDGRDDGGFGVDARRTLPAAAGTRMAGTPSIPHEGAGALESRRP
jgi:hypothetical protein